MANTRKPACTGLLGGVALLLALLGVLAMHGVGSHGSGHTSATASPHHDPVVTVVVGHAAHATSVAADHLASQEPASSSWSALCLAVLAGAVLLTLASGRGPGALIAPRMRLGRPGPPGRRDRDPPSLAALSVRRC